ncbi:hypothetical protein, partial [Methanomethylophilus alvi]|uniref:hypothetical protein n=1 Tax=Methanomethylophilus alvi TaxID=1291540 RepID=UPI0037DBF73D
ISKQSSGYANGLRKKVPEPGAPTEGSVWGLGEAIEKSPTQQAIPEFTSTFHKKKNLLRMLCRLLSMAIMIMLSVLLSAKIIFGRMENH